MVKKLPIPLFAFLVTASAHAQSSVTLYGLLSASIAYTNNEKGSPTWQFMSGPMQTPRFGMRGVEDLGGGNSAIFVLEGGYNVGTGNSSQGGREFGRQAYVGLSSTSLGTITFGRQYDEASLAIQGYEAAVQFAAYGAPIGDSDNLFNTFRIDNAVAFKSVSYLGLQFSALYAFSNSPGQFSNNNSISSGITYQYGGLSLGVGFNEVNRPNSTENSGGAVYNDYGFSSPFLQSPITGAGVQNQRITGTGGSYTFGPAKISALYTNVRFSYTDGSHLIVQNYELTATDYLTPSLMAGVGYIYTDADYHPSDNNPKWHQVDAGLDYFLSKRTDVFLVGIYQRAAGDATYADIYSLSPSTSRSQLSVTAGIRHKF